MVWTCPSKSDRLAFMSTNRELIEMVEKFGAHNYLPLPVVLVKGEGARVWDAEGKEYLDFLACYSALNFGHKHPLLLSALKDQAEMLAVCSRAFHSEELCHFSRELAEFCSMEAVLPMNSGTEAVETAIKVSRKWAYEKKGIPRDKAKIIAMTNNFHGRSITVVSFSSEELYRSGFGPFTPGFELVPYGNIKAVEQAIDDNTVGVLLEPIQAEAGILIPPNGYLASLKALCDQHNILLMFDEIQTGMGRTGKNFCYEHEKAKPDILILGKSLGGGLLPLSAIVAGRKIMDVLRPGEHGSTFGGNPLACAVGRAALKLLEKEKLAERATKLGGQAIKTLERETLPPVKAIRGRGLLIGIELNEEVGGARKYCEKLLEKGILCKETHENVIRIAPPLVIDEADLDRGLEQVIEVLKAEPY